MKASPATSVPNENECEDGEHSMIGGAPRNEMIDAARQVLRAAHEAGSIDAERVLQAVLELLEAASAGTGETKPAARA